MSADELVYAGQFDSDLGYHTLDLLERLDLSGVTLLGSAMGGWIALRYVKDPDTALKHFKRLAEIAPTRTEKARRARRNRDNHTTRAADRRRRHGRRRAA